MTPERWKEVEKIVYSALEREPHLRADFISDSCGGDHTLIREVESMVKNYESSASFLAGDALEIEAKHLALSMGQDLTGQKFGRFTITGVVGRGGMGEVYRARDAGLDRNIALKILPAHLSEDADRLARFRREAKVVSALNHPNILTVHEIGQRDSVHFIATELVDGLTLRERLLNGPIPIADTLEIAIQICEALLAAHTAKVVHRDIKPENIMIRVDGYVKVLDFGLAKISEDRAENSGHDSALSTRRFNTEPGVVMGTVNYMSPEQARAQVVDAQADIWSFGVVLSEMITGRKPFEGDTATDVLVAILERDPAPLDLPVSETNFQLESIVSKSLCKDRALRYQTIADVLVDLKRLRQDIQTDSRFGSGKTRLISSNQQKRAPTKRGNRNIFAIAAVVVFLVVVGTAGYFYLRPTNQKQISSIAVLPFVNDTGDPASEYISDGITESLINSLARLPNVSVTARSTSFSFKNKPFDLVKIRQDLNVDAVVTGRFTQRGESIILQTELVDVANGRQIWGDNYSRKAADIVVIHTEIAQQLARTLRIDLSQNDADNLAKRYTDNAEAYELYLQGRFQTNKQTAEDIERGIELFRKAISLDANYALAYAGLADAYSLQGAFGFLSPDPVSFQARLAAERSLALDPGLAEAHAALGGIEKTYLNWKEAERLFLRSIELNKNSVNAHSAYASLLGQMGRHSEAVTVMKKAQHLDPLSPRMLWLLGRQYYWMGEYDTAIGYFERSIELDAQFWIGYAFIAKASAEKGDLTRAAEFAEQAVRISKRHPDAVAALAFSYAKSGNREEARKILTELVDRSKQVYLSPFYMAQITAWLGDVDQAFGWLEKLLAEKSGLAYLLKVDRGVAILRTDPRYADMLKRTGLE
ncbi:MAG: protein kinase [Pyrinomonadaceae bacterium]